MFRNGLQVQHLLLLLLIVLVLFGANRLPDLARSVGKSARILKDEAKELRAGEPAEKSAGATGEAAADMPAATPDNTDTPPVPPRDAGTQSR